MNGKNPSENRIDWTTTSLNFSLPIMQSVRNLVNSFKESSKQYEKNTDTDSSLLYNEIRSKFGVWDEELEIAVDYDQLLFNPTAEVIEDCESPSAVLNTAYCKSTHMFASSTRQL